MYSADSISIPYVLMRSEYSSKYLLHFHKNKNLLDLTIGVFRFFQWGWEVRGAYPLGVKGVCHSMQGGGGERTEC